MLHRGLGLLLAAVGLFGQTQWPVKQGDVKFPKFRFGTGETIDELKIHYRTLGEPKRDASGKIRNAVLVLHGTSGSGTQFLGDVFAKELFGPGQALDIRKYYVILPDGIGHGDSSKPSDGLKAKFPRYGYRDMVEAQKRLVVEHLGIEKLRLIVGTSLGCMHIYLWAEKYGDHVQAAMPLACQPDEISGRNLFWRLTVLDAIRKDPAWDGGNYKVNPPSAKTAAALLSLVSGNPLTWQAANPTRDKTITNYDKTVEARIRDANDMVGMIDSSWDYSPAAELGKIKVPMTHINFADDEINPPELGITERLLKSAPTIRFLMWPYGEGSRGHGTHTAASVWKSELIDLIQRTERSE